MSALYAALALAERHRLPSLTTDDDFLQFGRVLSRCMR